MIARYDVKEISDIWSDESRFQLMLNVEIALLKSLEISGKIPAKTHQAFDHVKVNPSRITEIEKITRHDVIAFCTSITEQVPPEIGKYFHFGVTSSDILDTALSLQLRLSIDILINELTLLQSELMVQIEKTSDLLCIGRSHGMYAEPMIFAQKFLSIHQELKRRIKEYQNHLANLSGQLSGAVGNYTVLNPEIEALAMKELKLNIEPVSSQVIARDNLATIIGTGSLLGSCFERMSTEIRLLHHSDVREVSEGFKAGQKGSSTMPHKKNPVSSENITGLSRVVRSHHQLALENCNLWHERDISHSSAERMYLPDHFGLLVYICRRMSSMIRDLEINRENIESKALTQSTALSSYVLHEMILINNSSREQIYEVVQRASFNSKSHEDFLTELNKSGLKIPNIPSSAELKQHYIRNFKAVLKRSLGENV